MRNWLLAISAACALAACQRDAAGPEGAVTPPASQQLPELIAIDLAVGTGEPIATGSVAVVHYTGWLHSPTAENQKGSKFDSSRDRGRPFRFTVGAGEVIQGWDDGVVGMRVGGRRRLIVPPQLAYGEAGARGTIPPRSTLLFDVELLAIERF